MQYNFWFVVGSQALYGPEVLETVAERVNRHLSDRVAWTDFRQLMEMVVADPTAYPKPDFS